MIPTVVRDYETAHGPGHVESVTIIRTDSDGYPSGWNYSLHYGEIGGRTLSRYDNAHERSKGHERHSPRWDRIHPVPRNGAALPALPARDRGPTTMTTLTITIGRGDRLERETIDRIRAAEAGEELPDDEPVLNFDSYRTLARFVSDRNLELLETITRERPESIREAARLVDRDYSEVHRNLSELEDLGLLRFEGGEPGKAKRPVVEYDDIEVVIPLDTAGESVTA